MFYKKFILDTAAIFILCVLSNSAFAILVYEPASGGGASIDTSFVRTIAYDSESQLLTAQYSGSGFYTYDGIGSIYNITGSLFLTANIGNEGILSSGHVIWVGGGDGIADGSILMDANVADFRYVVDGPSFPNLDPELPPGNVYPPTRFDFILDVIKSESLLNLSDVMRLTLFHDVGPFTNSFTDSMQYTTHNLNSIRVIQVSEPGVIVLFLLGLAMINFKKQRTVYRLYTSFIYPKEGRL